MKSSFLAVLVAPVTLLTGCGDHHPQEVDTHALELKITHDLANTTRQCM